MYLKKIELFDPYIFMLIKITYVTIQLIWYNILYLSILILHKLSTFILLNQTYSTFKN